MPILLRAAFVLSFATIAVACSSKSSTSGPTADQACTDYSVARCKKISECSAKDFQARFADEPTCESRQKTSCLNAQAAPSTGATPSTLEACVSSYAGWSCNDYFANNPTAACAPKVGAIAAGGACFVSSQCQSQWCAIATTASCGTCATQPKAGDSCAATADCGPNLVCPAATNVCTAAAAQGGACDKTAPCGVGLSCVGATMTAKGACQLVAATAGAACDATRATAPDCDGKAGLYCNAMKQCASIAFTSSGQACGIVSGALIACSAGGFCSIAMAQTAGTCLAAAADGAACDTTNGPTCLAPARCVIASGTAGTCAFASASTCM